MSREEAKEIARQKKNARNTKYFKTPKGRYSQYKTSAMKRDYSFDLTLDEFKIFWNNPCSYCGDDIDGIGLDRVDNSLGYDISNVVSCCFLCNKSKSTMDVDEYKSFIKKSYDYMFPG